MGRRKHRPVISADEMKLFDAARRGDYNTFSRYYFELPFSGTIYSPEDRVDDYQVLYEAWRVAGRPENEFKVEIDGIPTLFKLIWGGYGDEPAILYHHGYVFLPWALKMLTSGRMIVVAEGGTGSAKTSSVAVAALEKCAAHPGFDFLNVAPTASQATDMMEEAVKWVTGSRFEQFIVLTNQGEIWKWKPYPIMTIDCGLGTYSTFGCMTLGTHGDVVLGKGKDWLNVDEASLVQGIGEAIPKLVTRYRGSRRNGMPRHSVPAFSLITNPHDGNPSFDVLKARAIRETADPDGAYFFIRPSTADNVYVTAQQIAVQKAVLTTAEQRRWMDGSDEQFMKGGAIPTILIKDCVDELLDEEIDALLANQDAETPDEEQVMLHDEMGIIQYVLPSPLGGRTFDETITWGDPGSGNMTSLMDNNIGTVGTFDVTGFPGVPATLVSMRFIDGDGKYTPWIEAIRHQMLYYQPMVGVYDASGMGKVFGEFPDLSKFPLYPVTLTGANKREAKGLFLLFASAGLFRWPNLKVLFHQAHAYRETGVGTDKLPDDLLAGLFVACFYMRFQYWDALSDLFNWENFSAEDISINEIMESAMRLLKTSRYARRSTSSRYSRRRVRTGQKNRGEDDFE